MAAALSIRGPNRGKTKICASARRARRGSDRKGILIPPIWAGRRAPGAERERMDAENNVQAYFDELGRAVRAYGSSPVSCSAPLRDIGVAQSRRIDALLDLAEKVGALKSVYDLDSFYVENERIWLEDGARDGFDDASEERRRKLIEIVGVSSGHLISRATGFVWQSCGEMEDDGWLAGKLALSGQGAMSNVMVWPIEATEGLWGCNRIGCLSDYVSKTVDMIYSLGA